MKLFFLLFVASLNAVIFPHQATAQDSIIAVIPVKEASFITTDPSGNLYVVTNKNTVTRYDDNGNKTGYYNNIQNGDLEWVDASNPLKILLFYPDFSKIILLDRMLSPKATVNLRNLGLFNVTACGLSEDNQIWVYDYRQAKLYKINDQLETLFQSNDLRSETRTVPHPTALIADNGTVYLPDTTNGIYTFDRFGTYKNTLAIKDVRQLQVINNRLIWFSHDTLHSYNQQTFQENDDQLPPDIISAIISRNRLYLLYPNKITILYIRDN